MVNIHRGHRRVVCSRSGNLAPLRGAPTGLGWWSETLRELTHTPPGDSHGSAARANQVTLIRHQHATRLFCRCAPSSF